MKSFEIFLMDNSGCGGTVMAISFENQSLQSVLIYQDYFRTNAHRKKHEFHLSFSGCILNSRVDTLALDANQSMRRRVHDAEKATENHTAIVIKKEKTGYFFLNRYILILLYLKFKILSTTELR